jgi:YVTN family beta-propeller protein
VEADPVEVAVNETTNRVYVTNRNSGTVSVIDGTTGLLVGSPIPVGAQPWGVAVNETANRVYVANALDDTVSVIDGLTGTVIGSPINVGARPHGVAVNESTNRVFVTSVDVHSVSVIDGWTRAVIGSPVTVGTRPRGLAVNEATNRVYVANYDANSVSVIQDTALGTLLSLSAPTTSAYRSARVYGYLKSLNSDGTATFLSGKDVHIQQYTSGVWKTVAKAVTSSAGRYSYVVKPSTKTTYRARYIGNSTYQSKTSTTRSILPRIRYSSAPRFSTYAHTYGRTYSVWGYIQPRHGSGSTQIKIKAYKKTKMSNGTYKYVYKKTFSTKVTNPSGSSYSKYRGRLDLPSRGTWRVRAYHAADSKNAATHSSYRCVTVR